MATKDWFVQYKAKIENNCLATDDTSKELSYWSNKLFALVLIYTIPFSLISLIPSLIWAFSVQIYAVAVLDLVSFICLVFIAFNQSLKLYTKKIWFIALIYTFSTMLILIVGLTAYMYLLISAIFAILILPYTNRFWPAILNAVIIIAYNAAANLNLIKIRPMFATSFVEQVAAGSNLLFLTLLCCALIPVLFIGLQKSLEEKKELTNELRRQKANLEHTLGQLQNKSQNLEKVTKVASQDLQEPFRMVKSFLTLLLKRYENVLDEKAKTYIGYALSGANTMKQIILDLLQYSKAGEEKENKTNINLKEIVVEIIRTKHKGNTDNLDLTINLPENLLIEAKQTEQVFDYLIDNSFKFKKMNENLILNISCTENNNEFRFFVADNGIGIDPTVQKNIFNFFEKAHNNKDVKGSGVGLTIAKKIVEHLGGTIWLISKPNIGSTFYFTIPK